MADGSNPMSKLEPKAGAAKKAASKRSSSRSSSSSASSTSTQRRSPTPKKSAPKRSAKPTKRARPSASTRAAEARAKAGKPTLVLLVRHGQTPTTGRKLPGRAPGLHLAAAGQDQAVLAAQRIASLDTIDAVYASPMERTQETAAPIARAAKRRTRIVEGLNECDFGQWTGKNLSTLRKKPEWATVQRYPSGFRFPDGESFAEMQTRMTGAIAGLVQKHPGDTIVCVSHADTIKAAVAHALGSHLDLFQRIVISPCSISAILYTAEGPIVLAVNSTGDDLKALIPS